jgi:putative endonuclease
MYTVYILYSKGYDRYYIGQTNDIYDRLKRHNNGEVTSTKPYNPWEICLTINKETRSESINLERNLKNLSRSRLTQFIDKYKG